VLVMLGMTAPVAATTLGSPWTAWVLDVPATVMLAGVTTLYLRGAAARGRRGVARPGRTAAFLGGVLVVLLAQVSPVAAFSEVLYWPHMVQHLLMTLVAAPLLAAGSPVATVRHGLSPGPRHMLVRFARGSRSLRRRLGAPHPLVMATIVHIAMIWLWHTPPVYDAAVASPALHLVEHAAFLGSAVWFWSEIWATARRHRRHQALATLCLGAMIIQGGALGALITFASTSLYDVYHGTAAFTALEDQQLAGALMWVPPGFVYGSMAVRRFIAWMRSAEADLRRRETRSAV
jgi:putative membrane protein